MNMEKFKQEVQEQLEKQEVIYIEFTEMDGRFYADAITKRNNDLLKVYNFRYFPVLSKNLEHEKVFLNKNLIKEISNLIN